MISKEATEAHVVVDNFLVLKFIFAFKLGFELLQEIIANQLLILLTIKIYVELDQILRNSTNLEIIFRYE